MTRLLLLLVALLVPVTALAGDAVDDRLAAVAAAYKDVPSLEADFVQTTSGMSFLEPLVQTGTIALEKPGQLAWRFAGAAEYLSDGTTLWVVDPRDKTCTVYRGMNAVLTRYFGFLTGLTDVRASYAVTLGEGGALLLRPLDANDAMGAIEVSFDEATGLVRRFKVTSPFGDQTDVLLSNVRTGRDLPEAEFTYAPREGFRTIEGS